MYLEVQLMQLEFQGLQTELKSFRLRLAEQSLMPMPADSDTLAAYIYSEGQRENIRKVSSDSREASQQPQVKQFVKKEESAEAPREEEGSEMSFDASRCSAG